MTEDRFTSTIPLEVAEALFDVANTGEFAVYSTVLEDFPTFNIPDEFSLLGSAVLNQRMRVGLATDLGKEAALSQLLDSFLASDWLELPYNHPFDRAVGFLYGELGKPSYRRLCHDQLGQISINFRTRAPRNLIVLSSHIQARKNRRTCAEILEQEKRHEQLQKHQHGAAAHMPVLRVPKPSASLPFSPGWILGGYSGSSVSAESEGQIEIEWPIKKVYLHFAEQLAEQNWAADAESIGKVSATGTWIKRLNSSEQVIGTLSVVNSENHEYQLKYTVELPGGGGSMAAIVRSTG